jgi:DNA modification methylase
MEKIASDELPINQVIEGDCLVEMPKIPDKSIDMILCDLHVA